MTMLLGDVHFGIKNGNKNMFETQMVFFEQQVFPYINKNKIKNVIFHGDLFDNRQNIDSYILQELKCRFFKWFESNNVKAHFIVGNHDIVFKDTIEYHHYKEIFNELNHCVYYDKPTMVTIDKREFYFVPWLLPNEKLNIPELVDIVCGHFAFVGFEMMKGIYNKEGIDVKELSNTKLVTSGHFHIKSEKESNGVKILYLGSTTQLNWGDYNEDKGFYILDKNLNLNFFKNEVSPRHIKILYNAELDEISVLGYYDNTNHTQIDKECAIEIAKNNFIKLYYEGTSTKKLDNFHQQLLEVCHNSERIELINLNEVVEVCNSDELEDNIKQETSPMKIINSYVNNLTSSEDIDKMKLNDCMDILYKEVIMNEK